MLLQITRSLLIKTFINAVITQQKLIIFFLQVDYSLGKIKQ